MFQSQKNKRILHEICTDNIVSKNWTPWAEQIIQKHCAHHACFLGTFLGSSAKSRSSKQGSDDPPNLPYFSGSWSRQRPDGGFAAGWLEPMIPEFFSILRASILGGVA